MNFTAWSRSIERSSPIANPESRRYHPHSQEGGNLANDVTSARPQAGKAPRWNIVSVALPVVAVLVGLLLLATNPTGRGDFAGSLGAAVLFAMGVGAACVLGEIAALVALARGEKLVWLTILGILGNGAVILPILFLLLKD